MPSIPALFTRLRHKKNSSSSSSNLSSPSTPNFGNSDRAQRKSLPPTPRDGHADRNGESHDRYASGRDSDDSPSRYRRSMDDRPRRDVSHNLPSQSPRKPVAAGDVVVNPARPAPPPPTKDQARSQDPSRVSEVVQHAQRDASSSLQYTTDNNTLPRHPYTSLHPYIDNSYIDSNASSPNIPILSSDTQSAFPLPPHTLPVMSALNDRSGSLSPSGNGLSKDDVRSVEHRKEKPVFNSMSRARKSEEGHVGRYSVQSDITPLSQVDGSRSGEQYLDLPTDAQTSLSQEIRESLQNEHGLSVGGETKRAGRDRKSLDASDIDIPKRGTSLHHDNGTGTPIAAVPLVDERGIGTRSHLTPEQFIAPYLANLSIRGTPHSPNTQPSEGHKHAFTGLPRLHHRKEESKDADYSHFNSPELEKLRQEQIQSIIVGAQKRRSERKALDQFGRDLFQKANMAHLIDTPDTVDIETTYLKPVIQETIIPREHIEYKTVIRRERHKHHIYPKIQPIEDPNPRILEPRHRIFSPETGKWHEVIGDQAAIEILGEDVFRNGPKEVRHKRQIDWDVLHGLISDTRETSASPGVVGTALTKLSQDELTKKGLGTGGKGRIVERRGIVGKPLSDWAEVGRAKIPGSETVSPGSIGVAV